MLHPSCTAKLEKHKYDRYAKVLGIKIFRLPMPIHSLEILPES